jgi:hypothetical protein
VLDERELADYLALSYLREGDPDAEPLLASFPVGKGAEARLASFFDERACRRRLEDGWSRWCEPAEEELLRVALRSKFPEFCPPEAPTRSTP